VVIYITNPLWLSVPVLLGVVLLVILVLLAKPILRYVIKLIANHSMDILLSDKYTQNLAEFLPSLKRYSVLNAIEMSLRAEKGQVINRPLGSPKHFLGFENLMFTPRQMTRFSLPASAPVDMRVTLGPNAKKPLTISIPLMISAMAYGLALSDEAKIALARAAKVLKTVTCSGEGPLLPEEAKEAEKYVIQIGRWSWGGRTDQQIASADMLEVQMGQGADLGTVYIPATELEGRAQELGGLAPGQQAEALPAPPGIKTPEDWPMFMKNLRNRAKGIPIALKIMATANLEEDLSMAVDLGFDVVVIDGAQGGSHASTPIKQDDFGLPSLNALVRAVSYLRNTSISIVVAGGYFTPGQCLKALALGADAIYMGTVPLFALAHNQTHKVSPWEPITTLVYYDSPSKTMLDIDRAAAGVVNTLHSMVLEMEEGMRALGKSSLKDLSPDDLVALDALTAEVTGVRQV
jgi:methylamine---glutamate N-methyltransferase subunit C